MTKATDSPMPAGRDRPELSDDLRDVRRRDAGARVIHQGRQSLQFRDYSFAGKRLTLCEAHDEGRLDIYFGLGGTRLFAHCSAFMPVSRRRPLGGELRSRGHHEFEVAGGHPKARYEASKISSRDYCLMGRGQYQTMLVDNVEQMDFLEAVLPTWVRFECLDRGDDLFAAQVGLSLLDGGFKSFEIGLTGDRELDPCRVGGDVFEYPVHEDIKSSPEVVDSVSKGQRDRVWRADILFRADDGLPAGVVLYPNHLDRLPFKEGIDLPVQVIDVMVGPINLKGCWPEYVLESAHV